MKHIDPQNANLRQDYHANLKECKNTLKYKKEGFHNRKLVELEEAAQKDPNSFWKTLKTVDETRSTPKPNQIPESQWLNHFKTLHSNPPIDEQQDINELLTNEEQGKNNYNALDKPITELEIKNAAKKLKRNKSAYSDKTKNEMIKYSSNQMIKYSLPYT